MPKGHVPLTEERLIVHELVAVDVIVGAEETPAFNGFAHAIEQECSWRCPVRCVGRGRESEDSCVTHALIRTDAAASVPC